MPKPWLKMWTEANHDPKMLGLTLAERGVWWAVLALAQECDAEGRLIKGGGMPLTIEEIADCLHIKTKRDLNVLKSMIAKMESQDSLHWNDETLVVTHFVKRQEQVPSGTKEAIKERVRQHRERQRVTEKALQESKGVTPPQTPLKEEEVEVEVEGEGNAVTPVTGNEIIVTSESTLDTTLAEIIKLHEQEFGLVSPLLVEKIKDFAQNYGGSINWIRDAFGEAVRNNSRRWAYVEAILNRWQKEGRVFNGRRENARGIREGGRHSRPGRDPEAGWTTIESEPDDQEH